ncbi:MAG: hypothetical protein NT166_11245 [Candidatus Aminicenantes bacterium]|nr:hypothetical protein [Candidatus Aminicenantes bacterium]
MPINAECKPNVFCYYDVTASAQDDDIKKKIQQFWPGNHEEITPGNEEQPTPGDNITSILVVHRRAWENTSVEKRKTAIRIFCKKADQDTLFVVFTVEWGKYEGQEGHKKWYEVYADGISQDRICLLLDKEFLEVLPKMSQYLKETPLSKWRIDGFYKPYTFKPQLTALHILCQGYLMVCEDNNDVKHARNLMGVTAFPVYNRKLHIMPKSLFTKVFGKREASELLEIAEKEWNSFPGDVDFEPVKTFINAATSTNLEVENSIVARAFIAIDNKLRGNNGK